jgi:hypothetical protein
VRRGQLIGLWTLFVIGSCLGSVVGNKWWQERVVKAAEKSISSRIEFEAAETMLNVDTKSREG